MITCILVTVMIFPHPILGIPCYVPLNTPLDYLTFSMFLILSNHCYLFKNFVVIIMFILNFMPRLPKTALLTKSAATYDASHYQVMSSPAYKPLIFSNADKNKEWHDATLDEIQALRSNNTWSLVPFHHSMNVVSSWWVYMIKHRVDDSVEQYKAYLVARGFTQQEGIDYS